jgi:hypothetical protein
MWRCERGGVSSGSVIGGRGRLRAVPRAGSLRLASLCARPTRHRARRDISDALLPVRMRDLLPGVGGAFQSQSLGEDGLMRRAARPPLAWLTAAHSGRQWQRQRPAYPLQCDPGLGQEVHIIRRIDALPGTASSAHRLGRYSRKATSRLVRNVATDKLTETWQLCGVLVIAGSCTGRAVSISVHRWLNASPLSHRAQQ